MSKENNNVNKDVANSLSDYSDITSKSINAGLNTVNEINKWYEQHLNKMTGIEGIDTRLETKVDNHIEESDNQEEKILVESKIETKVNSIDKNDINFNISRLKTKANNIVENNADEEILIADVGESEEIIDELENQEIVSDKNSEIPKRISTLIKGAKTVNNVTNKIVKTGKSINTVINENSLKSFENSSSRIMTKPVKKVTSKITKKATNKINKVSKKVAKKAGKTVVQKTTNALVKVMKLLAKLMMDTAKLIISMLPQIAPVIIILVAIVCLCSFFGVGMSEDTKGLYEDYMISTQKEYDNITVNYYNQGNIVDGAIEGKGMINWKAPLSIIQMISGDLTFDYAEVELLTAFKKANLFETITDVTYTYEKQIEETDKNGNKTTKTETITETRKVVNNPALEDYLNWCNNNFDVINKYKKHKKLDYDSKQTAFTESEIEQIELLYKSNAFFDLFSSEFKSTYAYVYVDIGDEQIQAIYDEFLKNAGTRYLMDHSNLKYDECMDYYDCSSWVIHVLGHTGIKIILNTRSTRHL